MSQWLLNSALILLPATGLLAYQGYPLVQKWQLDNLKAEQKIVQLALQQQEEVAPAPAVLVLPYPEFGELRAYQKQVADPPARALISTDSETVSDQQAPASQPEALLDELDLSELSPELSLLVQEALAVEASEDTQSSAETHVDKLPEQKRKYQGVLPPLDLQMHMYATDSQRRWVKINGHELSEGEWLNNGIQLVQIAQRHIVIRFNGQLIEIPQMYEWRG
jgi:general secretion pathway protein B